MKKGFTLLELVVVIIIVGILATLGLTQYGRMIERSRGTEAKAIFGDLRKFAATYYMEAGSLVGMSSDYIGIGNQSGQVPISCASSHFFSYSWGTVDNTTVNITATRCGAAGKDSVTWAVGKQLNLISNLSNGIDTKTGDPVY